MKEQTQITAEEWYKKHTENDLIRKRCTDLDFSVMEQYAQAKVLEALERVKEKLIEKTFNDGFVTSNSFKVVDEEISKHKSNK